MYPTLERLLADRQTTAPMAREHVEIRRLVAIGEFADHPKARADRGAVLALRRVLLRLCAPLGGGAVHTDPGGQLTPAEAALARALDHVASERL